MPLGVEVGLIGPGHTVLDGDSSSPTKSDTPPIFGPWPNGWMDQDATWFAGAGLGQGHIVLDGDPVPLPQIGGTAAPYLFGPCLIVAKRLDGSGYHLV